MMTPFAPPAHGRRRVLALAAAAALLTACSKPAPQADVDANLPPEAQAPKSAVMRLVGDLDFHDEFAIAGKTGAPLVKRGMVIKGRIDQLVTVEKSDGDKRIDFHPVDGKPLQLLGTVTEQGAYHSDDPQSNSIVKADGTTLYTGALNGDFSLTVTRSAQGVGDELSIALTASVPGKASLHTTMSTGHSIDSSEADMMPFVTLLERDNDDPTRRKLKKDWLLFPVLGARPADTLSQRMYDGIKTHPNMFHTGLTSAPGRNEWKYAGSKTFTDPAKPSDGATWTESLNFTLKLTKP